MTRTFGIVAAGAVSLVTCLSGCGSAPSGVRQIGAMRAVMRDGQTQGRIGLTAAVRQPHAYAVGALEELEGEITIRDGAVWVTRVTEAGPSTTGPAPSAGDRATLLTIAYVPNWRTVEITEVADGDALAALIERVAANSGVESSAPFPFVIEGDAADLAVHVINGYCPVATDPAGRDARPWRWSRQPGGTVTIVGFHAPGSAGVMTHHGSAIHAHAILNVDGRTTTAHVDRLQVAPGMTLSVPD